MYMIAQYRRVCLYAHKAGIATPSAPCMHGQAQAETSCACWHVLCAPVDPASSLAAALAMNDVQPHAVDGQTPNKASRSAGTAPKGSPRRDTKQFSTVHRPHCARRRDPAASHQLHWRNRHLKQHRNLCTLGSLLLSWILSHAWGSQVPARRCVAATATHTVGDGYG